MPDYPYSTAELDALRSNTDPKAEAVLDRLLEHFSHQEINTLFRYLSTYEHHDEVPEFLREFVEDPGALPDWVDEHKIRIGQQVFSAFGREIILSLLCRSLPMCYICGFGAEVLGTTTRLIDIPKNPNFRRRLLETFQFLIDVSRFDLVSQAGRGVIAARKVRLIHATIRRFIANQMEWPTEHLGEPINQEDQLMTMSAFGLEVIRSLKRMGINLNREEKEGWCHLWFTVGYLLGVEEEFIPADYDQCVQMSERIYASQARKTDIGLLLCASCREFMADLLPFNMLKAFSNAVFKYLNEPQYRDTMGYDTKNPFWDWFMPIMIHSTLGRDDERIKRSPVWRFLLHWMNNWLMGGLSRMVRARDREFDLPENLKPVNSGH